MAHGLLIGARGGGGGLEKVTRVMGVGVGG